MQEQVNELIRDMFDTSRVRYTSLEELSHDIWLYLRSRTEAVEKRLNSEATQTIE